MKNPGRIFFCAIVETDTYSIYGNSAVWYTWERNNNKIHLDLKFTTTKFKKTRKNMFISSSIIKWVTNKKQVH